MKIKDYLFFLWRAKKKWALPKKTNVLIFDAVGHEIISPYLKEKDFRVLHTRGEVINLTCLFFSLFKKNYLQHGVLGAYFDTYIEFAKPKVLITFNDNNLYFLGLWKRFPKIKTISIQNGMRDDWIDSVKNLYHVDFMFVFGDFVTKYINSRISGAVIPIGSIRNNKYTKSEQIESTKVVFISQFTSDNSRSKNFYYGKNGWITKDEFYKPDILIVKLLIDWCKLNAKTLYILPRELCSYSSEIAFYREHFNSSQFIFIKKRNDEHAYEVIDSSDIVVTVDSTLGYEAISRGKKTAFFSIRGEYIGSDSRAFGWPGNFGSRGFFWISEKNSANHFNNIMNNLNHIKVSEWLKLSQTYVSQLMKIDEGNSLLVSFIQKELI